MKPFSIHSKISTMAALAAVVTMGSANAATLFFADFQASSAQAAGLLTESNLNTGTATGSWTITTVDESLMGASGAVRAAAFERFGSDITANFASAASLSTGVSISYDAALKRNNATPRTSVIKGLASDGTVMFVLGLQGDATTTDPGYLRLMYFDQDFTADNVAGTGTATPTYVGSPGDFSITSGAPSGASLTNVTLDLSATSFNIKIDGVTVASNIAYLNTASNIARLNFTADSDGGAWYDNFNVTGTAVPEPSATLLGGLGMLALLRRRRA